MDKYWFENTLVQKLWQIKFFNVSNQFPTQLILKPPKITPDENMFYDYSCKFYSDVTIANTLNLKKIPYLIMKPIIYKEGIQNIKTYDQYGNIINNIPQYTYSDFLNLSKIINDLDIKVENKMIETESSSEWTLRSFKIDNVIKEDFGDKNISPYKNTTASIKIWNLVDQNLWNEMISLNQILNELDITPDLFEMEKWKYILKKYNIDEISTNSLRDIITDKINNLNTEILNQINETNKQAYIDGIISYWLSNFVSLKLTPFHPLLYCSFRANLDFIQSENGFSEHSNNIPVVCNVTENLENTLYYLLTEKDIFNLYDINDNVNSIYFNYDNLIYTYNNVMALLAQIIFGVHIFHNLTYGTLNNLNTYNLMYEVVDKDTYLYYVLRNKNIGDLIEQGFITEEYPYIYNAYYNKEDVYFAIPTNGYIIKATDPSFARVLIKDDYLYVDKYILNDEIADNTKIQNDLVSFFSTNYKIWTALYNLFSNQAATEDYCFLFLEATSCNIQYPFPNYQELMANNIIYNSIQYCLGYDQAEQCTIDTILTDTYSFYNRYCPNVGTLPEALFKFFEMFIVAKENIPECNGVFDLYPLTNNKIKVD